MSVHLHTQEESVEALLRKFSLGWMRQSRLVLQGIILEKKKKKKSEPCMLTASRAPLARLHTTSLRNRIHRVDVDVDVNTSSSTEQAFLWRRFKQLAFLRHHENCSTSARHVPLQDLLTSRPSLNIMDRPHLRASCKCGANQFVVDLPTFDDVHLLNCHCRACRRHAAAPWATYLYKDFVEQKLNPARGGRVGAGGSTTSHYVGLQWGQSVFYTAGDLHKEKFVKKVPFFPCSGLLEDSNKELQAARKWVCAVCHSSLVKG